MWLSSSSEDVLALPVVLLLTKSLFCNCYGLNVVIVCRLIHIGTRRLFMNNVIRIFCKPDCVFAGRDFYDGMFDCFVSLL